MRVVEIASWKRLEKPTRAAAVFTRAPSSVDVAEVIVGGEVRAVSVSCIVRACLSAAASRSRVEAFTFFSRTLRRRIGRAQLWLLDALRKNIKSRNDVFPRTRSRDQIL